VVGRRGRLYNNLERKPCYYTAHMIKHENRNGQSLPFAVLHLLARCIVG